MGRVDGKIAFITGGARGQGRAHAIRLAEEGADIFIIDAVGSNVETSPAPLANPEDLEETVRAVEALGRRVIGQAADVRDQDAVNAAVQRAITELGDIDIAIVNHGIAGYGRSWELTEQQWQDMLDVNLTGVWHTTKALIPPMIAAGKGGSIILTSSVAGVVGMRHMSHYSSSKHGVIGLMRSLSKELGAESIRVNAILPGSVPTPMVTSEGVQALFNPDDPATEPLRNAFNSHNAMAVEWLDPRDIANAALWLGSDEARYVTGVPLPVDAGLVIG